MKNAPLTRERDCLRSRSCNLNPSFVLRLHLVIDPVPSFSARPTRCGWVYTSTSHAIQADQNITSLLPSCPSCWPVFRPPPCRPHQASRRHLGRFGGIRGAQRYSSCLGQAAMEPRGPSHVAEEGEEKGCIGLGGRRRRDDAGCFQAAEVRSCFESFEEPYTSSDHAG